jgi:hypothetical protein
MSNFFASWKAAQEKINFVKSHDVDFPISRLCQELRLSTSTYYRFQKRLIHKNQQDELDYQILKSVFDQHHACYGYRRLKIALQREH